MKILIFISQLSSGGSEKVASLMANYWSESEHSVVLLTNTSIETDFFDIKENVKRRNTDFVISKKSVLSKIKSHLSSLKKLRNIVKDENPDIIISHNATSNVRMLIAVFGLNIPVIVEDHNNPTKSKNTKQPWKMLRPLMYCFSHRIVLLTQDLVHYYPTYLHSKIVIIPNPLDIPNNIPDSNEIRLRNPTFISAGNFRYIKGYDLLIKAFSLVVKKYPNWHLTILGDGDERENLNLLSDELGISDKIDMPGRVKNPYPILKKADIYVLSSRSEGFPVALCEAMGVSLPCISFDCPTGPSDIIENNHNGLLIDYLNIEKLAEGMIFLIENEVFRTQLAVEAKKINDMLNIETIMSKWSEIIVVR